MECICFEPYNDPRILNCGHSICFNCLKSIIKNNQIECPKCRSIQAVSNENQVLKNYDLSATIEEIKTKVSNESAENFDQMLSVLENYQARLSEEEKKNFELNGALQNIQERLEFHRKLSSNMHNRREDVPQDPSQELVNSGRNQVIHDFRNRNFKTSKRKSVALTLVFFVLFFPFDVAGMYYLDNEQSYCSDMQQWLIVWIIFSFIGWILSILNSGFLIKSWYVLSYLERNLRVWFIFFWVFMFSWIWVGVSSTFANETCRTNSNNTWAVSMSILIFWLALFTLTLLYFSYKILYRIDPFILLSVEKPSRLSFLFIALFFFLEFPFDASAIYSLSSLGSCGGVMNWFIIWMCLSFVAVLLGILNTGHFSKEAEQLSLTESILRSLLTLFAVFLICWLIVGAGVTISNKKCRFESNSIWNYSISMIGIWFSFTLIVVFISSARNIQVRRLIRDQDFFRTKIGAVSYFIGHFIVFDVQNIVAVVILSAEVNCGGIETVWLITWVVINLLLLPMPFIRRMYSNSVSRLRVCIYPVPVLMGFFLIVWFILGASMIFDDHQCEIESYKLWAICCSICGSMICLLFSVGVAFIAKKIIR